MRVSGLTCVAALAVVSAPAQGSGFVVDLLPGHPVYHESAQEAGVVMAIPITPGQSNAVDLEALCEELRVTAGLARKNDENLPLEVIFVVPYKGMAIEGYYLPAEGTLGVEALVRGNDIARVTLDSIVGRAGIPAHVLDETEVEHEISCELREPAWLIRWEDIRPVDGEGPDRVIESAYRRFMTIHRSVVEHAMGTSPSADLQSFGLSRPARRLAFRNSTPARDAMPQASERGP